MATATTTAVQPRTATAVEKPRERTYTNLERALWSQSFAADLARFLGGEEAAAAFVAEIFNQARLVPGLHQCSMESIRLGVARIAALRLNPALPNVVAFIPRSGEMTTQLGYAGLRDLVMRHPEVKDCFTRAVCANDDFAPPQTLTGPPLHRLPGAFKPRGPVIGYFAVVELHSGNWRWWPMSVAEIDVHVKRYVAKPGPAWTAVARPDEEGLTPRDKMSLKTCLRMLCNGRDVPMTAEVQDVLARETEQERRTLAAETQGYDRQGQRPAPGFGPGQALTPSTGLPMDDLLQDLAGVTDREAVAVRIETETRGAHQPPTAARPEPAGEAGLSYIARIEALIEAHPRWDIPAWHKWAENRYKKALAAFTEDDWQAYLTHLTAVAALPPDADASPEVMAREERESEASEYGGEA